MVESSILIPSLLSAVNGWFTPAVLFLLLNVVIGTIAITSKSTSSPSGPPHKQLSRAPSLILDRLKSFNLSQIRGGDTSVTSDVTAPEVVTSEERDEKHDHVEYERSRSEGRGILVDGKAKLASKMKKSASEKSAFGHFEEVGMVVEETYEVERVKRPQTARPPVSRKLVEEDGEVDAKCDDFINKFRHQLKLQRLDSIIRYKEMLHRGAEK